MLTILEIEVNFIFTSLTSISTVKISQNHHEQNQFEDQN